MNGIDLMIEEHRYIKRMLVVLRKASYRILQGEPVVYDDFYNMADFVKTYADDHHHGKEEQLLFNRMVDELGDTGEVIIKNGMLVEHDMGRFYMAELKKALASVAQGHDEAKIDVIANAVGYASLLSRHIDKEDHVVYRFAQRELSPETLAQIDAQCADFEAKQTEKKVQDHYIHLLESLEKNYL
jgi:hemerythrin-like domain-containing protein